MLHSFVYFQKLPYLSKALNIDLRSVRDDSLPSYYGGNKARKIVRIVEKINLQNCNAVVTTGGAQSNHARVVAMVAAERKWKCKLILHGASEDLKHSRGNLLLMQLAGADIKIVTPYEIAEELHSAMNELRGEGYNPYEIPGGGHCVEGALAYIDAVQELKHKCNEECWQPDWIILASGTGTTQAGIIVGLEAIGWKTRVIGVSVARKNPRGKDIVEQACTELREHLNLNGGNEHPVDFRDEWVGGGYEKADTPVFSAIRLAAKLEGLILDPTYTGKAFNAMLDLIASGEIQKGSKVLFWHTGGLLNLLASNYIGEILKL